MSINLKRDSRGNQFVALNSVQSDGTPKFAMGTRIGKEAIYATHDYTDPTTWYSESIRVNNLLLSSSDGYTWTSGIPNWIDVTHGKILNEERAASSQGVFEPDNVHNYSIIIEASQDGSNWETLDQDDPFNFTNGDFSLNYYDGYIVTDQDYTGYQIRASFSRANTSGWILRPFNDKVLTIEEAEIQFSEDVRYNSSIITEVYGNVDYFAPQFSALNGGPLPSGTSIRLEQTFYKTVYQLMDESIGVFPSFPPIGGHGTGRCNKVPINILKFRYGTAKLLYPSLGMYMRIATENDLVFGGDRCTATFYLLSKPDPGVSEALHLIASTQ